MKLNSHVMNFPWSEQLMNDIYYGDHRRASSKRSLIVDDYRRDQFQWEYAKKAYEIFTDQLIYSLVTSIVLSSVLNAIYLPNWTSDEFLFFTWRSSDSRRVTSMISECHYGPGAIGRKLWRHVKQPMKLQVTSVTTSLY